MERLGRPWLSAGVTVAVFALAHAGNWNAAHVLVVPLPLGAALTALYLWRRNLIVAMIAHFMIDLPLVIVAMTAS